MLYVAKLVTHSSANILYWTRDNIDGYRIRANIFFYFWLQNISPFKILQFETFKKKHVWKMFTNFLSTAASEWEVGQHLSKRNIDTTSWF